MKIPHCDKCEKPIKDGQHYFIIQSNHYESFNSWDTRIKTWHATCTPQEIKKEFEWHIKGEY